MKLNLGCGACVVNGWTNVDYGLGARMAKVPGFRALNKRLRVFTLDWDNRIVIQDLSKQFPWDDESVNIIYSSHLLEHFPRKEGRVFVSECFRVLRRGGIARLVVPDLSYIVREYVDGRLRADELVERLGVLYGAGKTGITKRLAPFISFPHKCMYDVPALLAVLCESGFHAESRRPFDSAIEDIERIEQVGRTEHAAIVEGCKP